MDSYSYLIMILYMNPLKVLHQKKGGCSAPCSKVGAYLRGGREFIEWVTYYSQVPIFLVPGTEL